MDKKTDGGDFDVYPAPAPASSSLHGKDAAQSVYGWGGGGGGGVMNTVMLTLTRKCIHQIHVLVQIFRHN